MKGITSLDILYWVLSSLLGASVAAYLIINTLVFYIIAFVIALWLILAVPVILETEE